MMDDDFLINLVGNLKVFSLEYIIFVLLLFRMKI